MRLLQNLAQARLLSTYSHIGSSEIGTISFEKSEVRRLQISATCNDEISLVHSTLGGANEGLRTSCIYSAALSDTDSANLSRPTFHQTVRPLSQPSSRCARPGLSFCLIPVLGRARVTLCCLQDAGSFLQKGC